MTYSGKNTCRHFLFQFICILMIPFGAAAGGTKTGRAPSAAEIPAVQEPELLGFVPGPVMSDTIGAFVIYHPGQICPGDPLFIQISAPGTNMTESSLSVVSDETGKTEAKGTFYRLPKTETVWICAVPFSTWTKPGQYTVRLVISDGADTIETKYPLTVSEKEFVSETIKLNPANTSIRTDTSPQKTAQIDRLNEILFTFNIFGVWQTDAFTPPTDAVRRTSFFGDRRIFSYSNGKSDTTLHYGIDYGIPTGTPVYACGKGRVMLAENRISTGWSVVIEHLPGLYSLYYHMDSLNVEEGAIVGQGDRIGFSGATGLATGPHLHWEIRLLGAAVNPDFFVKTGN